MSIFGDLFGFIYIWIYGYLYIRILGYTDILKLENLDIRMDLQIYGFLDILIF